MIGAISAGIIAFNPVAPISVDSLVIAGGGGASALVSARQKRSWAAWAAHCCQ